jgi:uncharacterized protein (DUF362 family)
MEYLNQNCDGLVYINTVPSIENISVYIEKFFLLNNQGREKIEKSKEIWIKPNITGEELPERGKTSQPSVLKALIDILLKFKSKDCIFVADSSVIGCDTISAARCSGILDACKEKGVKFIDLRGLDYKKVSVNNYCGVKTIDISVPFLEEDNFLINLAKLKSTYGSPVGFTLKNAKGVISDKSKLKFHIKSVQDCLCDLALSLNWDISILEGFPISELGVPNGIGPFGIANSSILLDYLMCLIVGIDPTIVGHIDKLADKIKARQELMLSKDINELRLTCKPLIYSKNWLEKIAQENGIEIINGSPCSGCIESFAKTLKVFDSENLEKRKHISILIGSKLKKKCSDKTCICIGNCAISAFKSAKYKAVGCPPTIDSMKSEIKRALNEKS